MDEYLFITLAKLQADRRKLEREQREALRGRHPQNEPLASPQRASGLRHDPLDALPAQWRAQS